jgi:hypothetical protein
VSTNGTYAASVDLSAAGLSGSGEWSVVLHNGYGASNGTSYAVDWVIDDLCLDSTPVDGCLDAEACNYNMDATDDDGSCVFANEGYDCDGNCILDENGDGVPDCDTDSCAEDLNGNGTIEVSDVLLLLGDFGCTQNCSADIDGDGSVAVSDVLLLLAAYGEEC